MYIMTVHELVKEMTELTTTPLGKINRGKLSGQVSEQ